MNKLLCIQASPRVQRSMSIMVGDAFVAEYLQKRYIELIFGFIGLGGAWPGQALRLRCASLRTGPSASLRIGGGGLRLGLIGVNGQHRQEERREKLGLIGFELGLFFL